MKLNFVNQFQKEADGEYPYVNMTPSVNLSHNKQTVEEASVDFASNPRNVRKSTQGFEETPKESCERIFKAGASWQKQQDATTPAKEQDKEGENKLWSDLIFQLSVYMGVRLNADKTPMTFTANDIVENLVKPMFDKYVGATNPPAQDKEAARSAQESDQPDI